MTACGRQEWWTQSADSQRQKGELNAALLLNAKKITKLKIQINKVGRLTDGTHSTR